MNVQVPPNLSYADFPRLLDAGINDWGGISPVTIDHVNPEAPWPKIEERLRAATEARGLELVPRLPLYPEYARRPERWCDDGVAPHVLRASDAEGLARHEPWTAGAAVSLPAWATSGDFGSPSLLPESIVTTSVVHVRNGTVPEASRPLADALAKVREGVDLDEDDVTTLFEARGLDLGTVLRAADELRKEVCGDTVSYVVTRNVNYTNVCYFRCGFCAFFQREARRKPPWSPLRRPGRRDRAPGRGGLEPGRGRDLPPGGIHPAFTGETYAEICAAVKHQAAGPPRPRVLGPRDLAGRSDPRPAARRLSRAASRSRPRLPTRHRGRNPGRRRPTGAVPGQGEHRSVARGARRCPPDRAALHDHDHVRVCGRGAKLGPPPAPTPRPAAADRRLHGVRTAAVRPHGGADLSEGEGPPGPDLSRGPPHACRRPTSAASGYHQRSGVLGYSSNRGRPGCSSGQRKRSRRHAHERIDLTGRGSRAPPGDAAGGDGESDPCPGANAQTAYDTLRHAGSRANKALLRRRTPTWSP